MGINMKDFIVASYQKLADKIKDKIEGHETNKKSVIKLSDGAKVVFWKPAMMNQESKKYEGMFRRDSIDHIKTNMKRETSLSVKTMARDYLLEQMLDGGTYTFDHMFLVRNPYGEAPLVALALFCLEEPARVRVTTIGDTPETDYVSVFPKSDRHRVPILGLYPARENKALIELLDDDDHVIDSHTIPVETAHLTKDLRGAVTVKKIAKDPAYDYIMINGGVNIHTCAFDKEGKIRYFLKRNPRGYGIFPLSKGHFFYMEKHISVPSFSNPQTVESYDMDYMGRVYRTYLVENGVHHTAEEKCDGNILVGSNTMLEHTEDRVIELDRDTGEIVWSLDIWDVFDDTYKDRMDWAHVNSAGYYERDHSVLISLRNVHAVICVDYDTKKMKWMLSDPAFWEDSHMMEYILKPVGDVPWTYQQHAAFELDPESDSDPDTKRIIVYDNHYPKRRKVKKYDKDPLSYVAIYDVNEKEKTVKLHKRFASPKVKIRANGIYIPDKGRLYNMAACYDEPIDGDVGGIYEYDYDTGEVVSEFGIKPGFFRAYEFDPCVEELAKPLHLTGDYMCGDIKRPQKMSHEEYTEVSSRESVPENRSTIRYRIQEDLFFLRNKDHEVKKVYFMGSDAGYIVHYDDTYQTMQIFSEMVYIIAMKLDTLPPDRYEIYLETEDAYMKAHKYIEFTE